MLLLHLAYFFLFTESILISHSTASLFSDECLRHVFKSYYDPLSDSCWIVEATTLNFDQAKVRCNHMPGYNGHLAFPKTLNQSWIISTKLSAADSWIGLQHFGSSAATATNKNEWYWVYPDGRKDSAADALWQSGYPTALECASANGGYTNSLYTYACTSTRAKFICQYDASTAHHETTLEHKCKQRNQWFWWEDDKSCLVLDNLQRMVDFSKVMCTHIPGYRGHLVHVTTMEKFTSIIAFRNMIQVDDIWIGMERERNQTNGKLGLYWMRSDGYKGRVNFGEYSAGNIAALNTPGKDYAYITPGNDFADWWGITETSMTLCEYEETLRYSPSLLDIGCANVSAPHIFYQGSCYVLGGPAVTRDVAKKSCNHIDGFNGRLAVLHSVELVSLIYYTLTNPTGGDTYNHIGLERLNTMGTNNTAGYYWQLGNGQTLPVTDFSPFLAGFPTGTNCGMTYYYKYLVTYSCTDLHPYICEYVDPMKGKHYRVISNSANTQVTAPGILAVYDDLTHQEMCGWQCTKRADCRSFVFNVNTRNCKLQSLDSSVSIYQSGMVQSAPGYAWFDRF